MTRRRAVPDFEVLTHRYSVAVHDHIHHAEHGPLNGITDLDEQTVGLAGHVGPDCLRETYLHEALHVVLSKAGVLRGEANSSKQEQLVQSLAPVLLDFLRRNPRALAFLAERE